MVLATGLVDLRAKVYIFALVSLLSVCPNQGWTADENDKRSTEVTQHQPYLLSESERNMLAYGTAHSELVRKSLNRVITNAIGPGFIHGSYSEIHNYFIEAVDEQVNRANVDRDNRYLSGWTFQRHAGFQHYYTIIDLKTGEVILASSLPGEIKLSFKTCVSKDFQHYATSKVREWLYDSATESERRANGGKLPSDWPHTNQAAIVAQEFKSSCMN